MKDTSDEKLRLLIRVCEMYYSQELGQQKIADKLGISRSQISRMLTAAKADGVVKITINNPFIIEEQYAKVLKEKFPLADAVIVNTDDANPYTSGRQISRAGAAYLMSLIRENDIITVMAGKSVHNVCSVIKSVGKSGVMVVPSIGGWGSEGSDWHANSNAQALGESLRCKYYFVNAPSVVSLPENRDTLLKEKAISTVLDIARHARIALMGIGQARKDATVVRSGVYDEEEMEEFKRRGAVGTILSFFIDKDGKGLDSADRERQIGLTAEELRRVPQIIAVAYGKHKAEAICAALRGGWVDTLVTDVATAKAILEV